jgi:hypothetical protein
MHIKNSFLKKINIIFPGYSDYGRKKFCRQFLTIIGGGPFFNGFSDCHKIALAWNLLSAQFSDVEVGKNHK